ncbi:MAG: glycosyltransferase [Candidatus Micrarchaeota archaeon]|nr:glycosyltransferase [Candidatus Micrarchaeota archaeon]
MISVVIPAYNEEHRIGPTLRDLSAQLAGKPHEILVVFDGSDQTPGVIASLKLPHVRILRFASRMGKGAAIRAGFLAAKGDRIVMCDADGSMPASELFKLLGSLSDHDVAIGNRYSRHAKARLSFAREAAALLFNRFARFLFGFSYPDTQCGYKAFRAPVARKLAEQSRQAGFVWDVEALALCKKNGFSVASVPVAWEEKDGGVVSKNTLAAGWSIFWDVLKLRFRH